MKLPLPPTIQVVSHALMLVEGLNPSCMPFAIAILLEQPGTNWEYIIQIPPSSLPTFKTGSLLTANCWLPCPRTTSWESNFHVHYLADMEKQKSAGVQKQEELESKHRGGHY
ncbi:hypothetical protein SO802_004729 [Lithocarpus litseifolius]|uniref:Uncharacterized protein n=1 Tax=Lithocarpus litseifolius TaxID=425828 RepID=A0AAW2E7P0_9ROSI